MRPIKTAACDDIYRGPTPEIGDLHCQRLSPGAIRSFWKPSEEELAALNAGGAVQLDVFMEPLPPLAVNVINAEKAEPVGEHPFKESDAS